MADSPTTSLDKQSPYDLITHAIRCKAAAIKQLRQPDPCPMCNCTDHQEQNLHCQGAAACPQDNRATALRLLDTLRAPVKLS